MRIGQCLKKLGQKFSYRYQRIVFFSFFAFALCLTILGVANVAYINIQAEQSQKQLLAKSNTNTISVSYTVAVQALNDIRLSKEAEAWATATDAARERLEAVHLCSLVKKKVTGIGNLNYSLAMYKINGASSVFYKDGFAIEKEAFLQKQLGITSQQEWEKLVQVTRENGRYFHAAQGTQNEESIVCLYNHRYWNAEVVFVVVVPCGWTDSSWAIREGNRTIATNLYGQEDKLLRLESDKTAGGTKYYTETFADGRLQCVMMDEESSAAFILRLLLSFLLLLAVGAVMMYYVSQWFYRPLNRLLMELDVVPEEKEPTQTKNVDEFALLRDNIFHLKLINRKMQEALDENRMKSKEQMYIQLFTGNASENSHTAEIPQCVAVLRIEEEFDDDRIFLLKNDLRVFAQEREVVFAGVQPALWCLVFFENDLDKVERIVRQALNDIFTESEIVAAISDVKHGKKATLRAYKQALHILEACSFTSCGEILRADHVREEFVENFYYPISLENELIHSVVEGKASALALYDETVRENLVKRRMSIQQIENFIMALINTLNRISTRLSASPVGVSVSTGTELLSLYESSGEHAVTEVIRAQIAQIVEDVNRNRSTDNHIQMQKMLDYIHENYMKDIGLTDIAEEIGITPQHCSIVFKQLTNDNFKNYLNSYRIKKAQKLQEENPGITTAQLAQQVGFNSSNSFIRAYKKYTGISPQNYMKQA